MDKISYLLELTLVFVSELLSSSRIEIDLSLVE